MFTAKINEEMTKEQFLDGVRELVQDMADPKGEFQEIASEGELIVAEVGRFDPVMATKLQAIVTSIRDFGDYVRSRAEFLGTHAETR